jgi:tRNA(fMet)-specific endonuclease VapC
VSFLIDTDVLIELERKTPAELFTKFARNAGQLYVSTIGLAELFYGVAKSSRPQHMRQSLEALLTQLHVLNFDAGDAANAGQIREELRRAGTPIGPHDMLIAAQARARGFTLVTGNTREFERVPGLRVENWLES